MPMTAATNASASTAMRKTFQLTSSATTDGTGATSLTIAHGFGAAQRISAASDATNRVNLLFSPALPAGGPQGWYTVSIDATNIIVSRQVNVAGSADNGIAVNLIAQVTHSLVE